MVYVEIGIWDNVVFKKEINDDKSFVVVTRTGTGEEQVSM